MDSGIKFTKLKYIELLQDSLNLIVPERLNEIYNIEGSHAWQRVFTLTSTYESIYTYETLEDRYNIFSLGHTSESDIRFIMDQFMSLSKSKHKNYDFKMIKQLHNTRTYDLMAIVKIPEKQFNISTFKTSMDTYPTKATNPAKNKGICCCTIL